MSPTKDKIAYAIIYGGSTLVFYGGKTVVFAIAVSMHLINRNAARCMSRAISKSSSYCLKNQKDRAWKIYEETGELAKALEIFFS